MASHPIVAEQLVLVTDRSLAYAKKRPLGHRLPFKEIVDPIFSTLQTVLEEYRSMFEKLALSISNSDIGSFETAVDNLRIERAGFEVARAKLEALVVHFVHESDEPLLAQFFMTAARLFECAFQGTPSLVVLERGEELVNSPSERVRRFYVESIQSILHTFNRCWNDLNGTYTQLKQKYFLSA